MATPYNKTVHLFIGSFAGPIMLQGLAAALSAQAERMQGQPAGTQPIPCPAHEGLAAADMSALACVQALEQARSEQAALRQLGNALAAQGHAHTEQGHAPALAGQWTAQQLVCPHP